MSEDKQTQQPPLSNSQLYSKVRQYFQAIGSMDHVQQERIKLVQGVLERMPEGCMKDFIFAYEESGDVAHVRVEGLESTLYVVGTKDRRGSATLQLSLEANATKACEELICTANSGDGKGTRKWARMTLDKVCAALKLGEYDAV